MGNSEEGPAISGDLSGVYGYGLYDGREIPLSGKANDDGTFTLYELDADGKKTASWTGRIDMDAGTLKGTWHNAANTKTYPIEATLKGMSESIEINQAVPRDPDNGISAYQMASSTLTLPFFLDPSDQGLNATINQKLMAFTQATLKDKSGISAETNEIRALTPNYAVIVKQAWGYGFGAAHGGSSKQHLVFSHSSPQQPWHELTYADISAGNLQQCLPQLRGQMIAELKKAGASMTDQLEAKDIPSLDFLPTQDGIHFYFGEYQVGSYAEGTYQIFLRYSKSQGCLIRPANFPITQ